ncbi:hypothetical protein ABVT39_020235 [Epinephelus coioides]
MIGGLAALILLSTGSLLQTAEVPHQISLTVAELGGNVTLQCPVPEKDGKFFYWYKQSLGYMAQTVATAVQGQLTVSEQFDNPRFKAAKGAAQYLLTITNVNKEDEATYFCHCGAAYSWSFSKGIFLAVNGSELEPVVLALGVLLACCVTVIVVLIFYGNRRKVCEHCKASHHLGHDRLTVDQSNHLDGEEEALNYVALEFSTRKVKRGKRKIENTPECVYSFVKADDHNQQHPSL